MVLRIPFTLTTVLRPDVLECLKSWAHSILQHEGLYKVSILLDQFKDGLRRTGISTWIECFPKEFAPLFICSGTISNKDVIDAMYMRKDRTNPVSIRLLQQYISSLSQQGIELLYTSEYIAPDIETFS